MTLPVLTRTLTASDSRFGSVLGRLYGWNTLGAVLGVVGCELYLVDALGIRGTALAAGALNLLAATLAMSLSILHRQPWPRLDSEKRKTLAGSAAVTWVVAAFMSGFCLLVLEVVWFRLLLLFVMGDSMAFALMLGIVLAGIALGGLTAARWLRRSANAHRVASDLAFFAAALCAVSYALFPRVIRPFETRLITGAVEVLQVGVPLMFPVSLLSGVLFTFIGAALRDRCTSPAETTGTLTLANTAGAALGSLGGGFVFIPVLGVERSLALVASLYGVTGLWLLRGAWKRSTAFSLAIAGTSLALFPFGLMEKQLIQAPARRYDSMRRSPATAQSAAPRVAAVREGLTETIVYLEMSAFRRPLFYQMFTNAIAMADTEYFSRRYMKLYAYWPMAVHPQVKHALLICYGIGNTAKALTDSKTPESIDIVDISPDVLEMNRVVYPVAATSPLSDARVRVHIEDGRYFLQSTDRQFDLITAEPPPPRTAGAVNLYTREYFRLLRDRLSEGGIVAYWLPLHAISDVASKAVLRAFCDIFNDCSLWNGMGAQLMMVGSRNRRGPVSEAEFAHQWQDPVIAVEMRRLGLEIPEQLGALFIGDAAYLNTLIAESDPLLDDYPKLIEAPNSGPETTGRLYRSLTDVAAARERFAQSPLIRQLWPDRLRQASSSYFETQGLINSYGSGGAIVIEDVHRVLTETRLTTPVLWFLGSDWDTQQAIIEASPAELAEPEMQFHLGIRLIAERSFVAAAAVFARAEAAPALRARSFAFRIYALCMAGQVDYAKELTRSRLTAVDMATPFWNWLRGTFGL